MKHAKLDPGCGHCRSTRVEKILRTMAGGLVFLWAFGFAAPCFAAEKISLQLAWKHQFQFAGYYAALDQGYYRDAGLEVTIVEGGRAGLPGKRSLPDGPITA